MTHELLFRAMEKYVVLSEESREKIRELSIIRNLRKRQYLLQEGDVMRTENFVLKGCLRTYEVSDRGQEHVIQFSVEEWWAGDLYSFLTETPSRYNIDCLEDVTLLQFTGPAVNRLYDEVPGFERYFRILLQNAFIAMNNRVLSSMSRPAAERYAEFLERYPHIEQRVTNQQIASYLGITPESLSRIRRQFAG